MKTCIKNKCTKTAATRVLPAVYVVFAVLAAFVSCSDIYDNITKHENVGKIYADKLDGIINVQVGYERVEIDLMKAGRIPASRIVMGKAKKTVIECEDFTEPGHRRVIDSVCSWVNITGLTELKMYQFTIYTEDEFGNSSIPYKAEAMPYTAENLNALELLPPGVIESTSAALIEWKEPLSSKLHDFFRYRYEYTDKDGIVHTGGDEGDVPSFLLENVRQGQDINIKLSCRIVPKLLDGITGNYYPILDTIDWQPQAIRLNISSDAKPAIFLKTPGP
ncbi:MAG: DUF4998 domain-containing protein, partial [Tannerella sp.]|nr:DUF4998 domain-containing protein [Tannerella sp.]